MFEKERGYEQTNTFTTGGFEKEQNITYNGKDCKLRFSSYYKFYNVRMVRQYTEKFVGVNGRSYFGESMRVNFEIRDGEAINLSFLSSIMIKHFIMNKDVGSWVIAREHVNFAYAAKYLNKAFEFVLKREKKERELIESVSDKNLDDYPEWELKLSEWKFKNRFRSITETRAKRFVKSLE